MKADNRCVFRFAFLLAPPRFQVTEDSHWEYWMRKNANEGKGDAVFNGLEYKPVSVMMPVPAKDETPYWGWFVSMKRE